jgi:hypothetical protein
MGHGTNGSLSAVLELIRDRLHREVQVGPGVPVGHREHIDAIELLALKLGPMATRRQSPSEPRTIDITDLHP